MDKISNERLKLVHTVLAERIHKLGIILIQEEIDIRVVQGVRSWQQQDELYAKGRTVPPIGRKFTVTNARGGESWHNFGLAVDVAPDDPDRLGWQPNWNAEHRDWKRIVQAGESLGLTSGVSFHDLPHFEMTGRFPSSLKAGALGDEVRYLYQEGGIQTVWNEAFK